MARILYIGDYYPMFSFKAKLNAMMAEAIHKKGHEVFLLSKSWCMVEENNFYGTVEELSQTYPFRQKYFIDPIQMQNSGLELSNAYLGLGCKIMEKESIEQIIFADDIIYLPVVEMLKSRYKIPCVFFAFWAESWVTAMNDYVFPYMKKSLDIFDKIFTYPDYSIMWKDLFEVMEDRIFCSVPVENTDEEIIMKQEGGIYLLCENNSPQHLNKMIKDAKVKAGINKNDIKIITPDFMAEGLIEERRQSEKVYIKDLPEQALVLSDYELEKRNSVNISYLLTVLACRRIPLINKNHLDGLSSCNIKYKKVGNFYALYSFIIDSEAVDSFL